MIVTTYKLGKLSQAIPFQVVQNQHALLMPIGDIHFGMKDFPGSRLNNTLQWAINRGCVFIGMGDYLDFASDSQRNIISGTRESVKEQLDELIAEKVLKLANELYSTRGRWIGLIEGNHYWEFADGTTSDQLLCRQLGCDFLGTSALVRIHPVLAPKGHPEADTIIYAHHGIGSSRKIGGHLNRVEDMLSWIDFDIGLMGHSHAKIFAPMDYQTITPDNIHSHRTKLVARTGSWLKGYASHGPLPLTEPAMKSRGTYIEKKAYPPAALGAPLFGIGFEKIKGSRYFKPSVHGSM